MAAFNRPTEATYEVHENISVDTQDNEDHTFCGIMFPIKCKDLLPLDHLVIKSVAVRGRLGPLTVWVSNPDQHHREEGEQTLQQRIRLSPKYWTKLYEREHEQSRHLYKELVLTSPIRLNPGETRVIYIHSTRPGDESIVYDNSNYGQTSKRYEDEKLSIMTGRAHVSNDIFGQVPIWGGGNAWRDRREFVGRLNYGTVYKLWNPQVQPKFGGNFQDGARAMFLCQRRWESPMSRLPDECIFYILNMCRWDWFDDNADSMKQRRQREKAKKQMLKVEATQRAFEEAKKIEANAAITAAVANEVDMEGKKASPACRPRRCKTDRDTTPTPTPNPNPVVRTPTEDDGDVEMSEEDDAIDEETSDDEGANNGDDEELWETDEDDDDEDDDESEDEWPDQYHRANINSFTYRDIDSDEENNNDAGESANDGGGRRTWLRSQFSQIRVLRALARMEDGEVDHLEF